MRSNRVWIVVAVIAVLILLIPLRKKLTPISVAIPKAPTTIAELRGAKDSAANQARLIKNHLFPLFKGEPELLYGRAEVAYNKAIDAMLAALESDDGTVDAAELNRLLAKAAAASEAYNAWFRRKRRDNSGLAEATRTTSSGPIEFLLDVAEIRVEWEKMEQDRDRQRRDRLEKQLEGCRWKSWDEL